MIQKRCINDFDLLISLIHFKYDTEPLYILRNITKELYLIGWVVIILRTPKNVLPTNIFHLTLKAYNAVQEMEEHIFEGGLIYQ